MIFYWIKYKTRAYNVVLVVIIKKKTFLSRIKSRLLKKINKVIFLLVKILYTIKWKVKGKRMARKSKLLENLGEEMKKISVNNPEQIGLPVLKEFAIIIKELTDYRGTISYQPLENIIMIVFIALLANCNEWNEIYQFGVIHKEWFSKFLNLEYGIPSVSTLRKTMAVIDPEELEELCVKFIIKKVEDLQALLISKEENEVKEKEIISYDGKTCNGSSRNNTINGKVKPVNAMSAFNVDKDICLKTKFIDEKTNEIPTGPELIKYLDLTNTISVFDALNTQEKTIKSIVDKHGNYVAAVKGNQRLLYEDIKNYFNDEELYKKAMNESFCEETEKAHNQVEKRTYIITSDIDWLNNKDRWANIKSIGIAIREYTSDENNVKDVRYYITDLLSSEIKEFKKAVRDEWGIENNLHWHLDYTFKEDNNLTMNKNAQANLNILRKLCLNILKLIKPLYNKSLKLIRFIIGQNFDNEILKILSYINIDELKKIANFQ